MNENELRIKLNKIKELGISNTYFSNKIISNLNKPLSRNTYKLWLDGTRDLSNNCLNQLEKLLQEFKDNISRI